MELRVSHRRGIYLLRQLYTQSETTKDEIKQQFKSARK